MGKTVVAGLDRADGEEFGMTEGELARLNASRGGGLRGRKRRTRIDPEALVLKKHFQRGMRITFEGKMEQISVRKAVNAA